MLAVGWFVLAVLVAVLLTLWVTFTLTRLDRLHARVDAAEAALDAQLVRRAVAVQHLLGDGAADHPVYAAAAQSVIGLAADRLAVGTSGAGAPADVTAAAVRRLELENTLSRATTALLADAEPSSPAAGELREAAARVLVARRFYNDAVRDSRTLRARRLPRLLHLAGHRPEPEFFDIDDTLPPAPVLPGPDATVGRDRPAPPREPWEHPVTEEDR